MRWLVRTCNAFEKALASDGPRAVKMAVWTSPRRAAFRNGPALYVIAAACASADPATKAAAFAAIPQVCRIGTHLFNFAAEVQEHRLGQPPQASRRPVVRDAGGPAGLSDHQGTSSGTASRWRTCCLSHPTRSRRRMRRCSALIAGATGMGERKVAGPRRSVGKTAAIRLPALAALPALVRAVEQVRGLDLTVDKDRRKMAALVREHRLA